MKTKIESLNIKVFVVSCIPFILWLIPIISGNVELTFTSYLLGTSYFCLVVITAIKGTVFRLISMFLLSIIVVCLYFEGLGNDMFGSLYPILIFIFLIYYIVLNYMTLKGK